MADPAVRATALSRLVALAGAPVTLWLVATRVAPAEQGMYFVAINLVALALFLEVGPGTILVQFAAHESGRLRWTVTGDLAGDPAARARVGIVLRRGLRWYAAGAVVLLVLAGAGGLWLGSPTGFSAPELWWWITTCALVAAYFVLVPFLNVSEGCGAILPVQRMRSVQAASVLGGLWAGLLAGDAHAACVFAAAAQLAVAGGWLLATRRGLLRTVHAPGSAAAGEEPEGGVAAHLRVELRRSAQFWLALFLAPQLLTPAVLRLHGGSEAGQFGLTMALALAPLTIAVAWLHARYPALGAFVARKAFHEFEATARRAFGEAVAVFVAGCAGVVLLVLVATRRDPLLAARVLPAPAMAGLLAGAFALLALQAMAAWVRAFRSEALRTPTVGACVAMCALGMVGARLGGGVGASLGFGVAGVVSLVPASVLFLRARSRLLS